jgi:hypothetical protein
VFEVGRAAVLVDEGHRRARRDITGRTPNRPDLT